MKKLPELFLPVLKEHGVEAPFEKVVTVVGMMKDRVSFIKELWVYVASSLWLLLNR